jgi:hypothetical protein
MRHGLVAFPNLVAFGLPSQIILQIACVVTFSISAASLVEISSTVASFAMQHTFFYKYYNYYKRLWFKNQSNQLALTI